MWTWGGKGRVRRTGRVGLTYIYCPVWNRQLVGSCCIARGAQLSAVMTQRGGREVQEGSGICIHIADSLCCIAEANTTWVEKAMATHSSTFAWKIPWMEEPGGLQSMGSRRIRHNWATSLSLFTCMPWRRKWQPTPVLLPGKSQGRRSLVGCRLWGCTESDKTEAT